jgi:hypothetical protein
MCGKRRQHLAVLLWRHREEVERPAEFGGYGIELFGRALNEPTSACRACIEIRPVRAAWICA